MWIFCKHGGVSIVNVPLDKADRAYTLGRRSMQVRGRCWRQLQKIRSLYCHGLDVSRVQTRENSDYQYRFYLDSHGVTVMLERMALDVDYENFKDAVPDKRYKQLLTRVWRAFYEWASPDWAGCHGAESRDITDPWEGVDIFGDPVEPGIFGYRAGSVIVDDPQR